MRRRFAAVLLVIPAALAFATFPASAKTTTVTIQNVAFDKASFTIGVGDAVRWMHKDDGTPHTVTSDDGSSFDSSPRTRGGSCNSGILEPDDCMYQTRNSTFGPVPFNTVGDFGYHCKIHTSMHGVIRVRAPATSPSPTAPGSSSASATATATATSPSPSASATTTGSPTGTASASTDGTPRAGADGDGSSGGKIAIAVIAVALLGAAGFVVYRRFIASP